NTREPRDRTWRTRRARRVLRQRPCPLQLGRLRSDHSLLFNNLYHASGGEKRAEPVLNFLFDWMLIAFDVVAVVGPLVQTRRTFDHVSGADSGFGARGGGEKNLFCAPLL